jgi:ribosomal protein S18 acetylase RimI-like enzyme
MPRGGRITDNRYMPLAFRPAEAADYDTVEAMVIESFEPITWFCRIDARFGPLNGQDWRTRWRHRVRQAFDHQIVLLGETDGRIAAASFGTIDGGTALAYIDLLAVDRELQRRGYGREMLQGMMQHLRECGARYVYLDCMADNDAGNGLYAAAGFTEVARQVRWFRELP